MPQKKNRYESANEDESVDDDEIVSSSQERYVLTIPSIIYNTVASENTWTIALIALFLVTAVGVLGIFLDDDQDVFSDDIYGDNYYYESYDGGDKMIYIPKVLYPLEDISRDEIFYEEEEEEEIEKEEEESGKEGRPFTMAFFLDIPYSGGKTFLQYVVPCFDLIGASDLTTTSEKVDNDNHGILKIIDDKGRYANVNTYTMDGLLNAKQLKLVDNMDIDILSTPYFYETIDLLFSTADTIKKYPSSPSSASTSSISSVEEQLDEGPKRRLRMITLMRDPIERLVTTYYENNKYNKTLLEYLKNDDDNRIEYNYVTKLLVNKLLSSPIKTNEEGQQLNELTNDDLIIAKQILYQKCIIGLHNQKADTISRWKKLFAWKFINDDDNNNNKCPTDNFLAWEYDNDNDDYDTKNIHVKFPDEDSEEYNILVSKSLYDIELYEYAKDLFFEQGSLFV